MGQVKNLCNKGIVLEKGRIIRQDDEIQKSIDNYLGKNSGNSEIMTTRWENAGKVYDESFNPISMEILDENDKLVAEPLDYEKDYKIQLKVNVINPDKKIGFRMLGYRGTERLFAMPMPKVSKFKTGINLFSFCIPKKALIPGDYVFTLEASVTDVRWIVDPDQFEIIINTNVKADNKIFCSRLY